MRVVLLAVLLVGVACSNASDEAPRTGTPERAATVRDLSSIDELQERFNGDEGVPRLILLISPT
jgi:hypothetical protein